MADPTATRPSNHKITSTTSTAANTVVWYRIRDWCFIGVQWNWTRSGGTFTYAPKLYRWDKYGSDSSHGDAGYYYTLKVDGSTVTSGSVDFSNASSAGSQRALDTYSQRSVAMNGSTHTIRLEWQWYDWWSYDSSGVDWDCSASAFSPADYVVFDLTVPAGVPVAPSDVSASISGTAASISFKNNSSSDNRYTQLKLQRSVNGGAFADVKTLSATATTASDTVSPGNQYQWRVAAYNGYSWASGDSSYAYSAPVKPTSLSASFNAQYTKFNAAWSYASNANSRNKAQLAFRKKTTEWGAWEYIEIGPSVTTYSYPASGSIEKDAVWEFAVREQSKSGEWSDYAFSSHMYMPPVDPGKPSVKRNNDYEHDISWTLSGNPGNRTAVNVWRNVDDAQSSGGVGGYLWSRVATLAGDKTSWRDTKTEPGHSYRYLVETANASYGTFSPVGDKVQTAAAAPSSLAISREAVMTLSLAWSLSGGLSNRNAIVIEVYEIGTSSAVFSQELASDATSYTWRGGKEGSAYRFRVAVKNDRGAYWSDYSKTAYWIPDAPSNVRVSISDDLKASVTWTAAGNAGNREGYRVYRNANGEGWNLIATLTAGATSYDDKVSRDNGYAYRVESFAGNFSASADSSVAYTRPARPIDGSAAYDAANNRVIVSVDNGSRITQGIKAWYYRDGWQYVGSAEVGNSSTAFFSVSADMQGEYDWRIANYVGALESEYLEIGRIAALAPPNAPRIVSPASGAVFQYGQQMTVSWIHNSADGSPQTRAEVRVGSTVKTVIGDASQATIDVDESFGDGSTKVYVKTWGSHPNASPESQRDIRSYPAPSVSIESMAAGSGKLITAELDYKTVIGNADFAYQRVRLFRGSELLYTLDTSDAAGTIDMSGYALTDGESFRLTVNASATNGLAGTATIEFAASMEQPGGASVQMAPNAENGHMAVSVSAAPIVQQTVPMDGESFVPAGSKVIRELDAYGKSEQAHTMGKNLFRGIEVKGKFISSDGAVLTSSVANGYSYAIPVDVGSEYTFSGTSKIANYTMRVSGFSSANTSDWAMEIASSVIALDERRVLKFTIPSGVTHIRINFSYESTDIQLEKGDAATEYEPYTGGIASPNPEYPQPIVSVKGKNLLDGNLIKNDFHSGTTGGDATYIPIYVGDGAYTLSSNVPKWTASNGGGCLFFLAGNVTSGISSTTNAVYDGHPITVDSVGGYVTVCDRPYSGNKASGYDNQLENGSTATEYVPYGMLSASKKSRNLLDLSGIGTATESNVGSKQSSYDEEGAPISVIVPDHTPTPDEPTWYETYHVTATTYGDGTVTFNGWSRIGYFKRRFYYDPSTRSVSTSEESVRLAPGTYTFSSHPIGGESSDIAPTDYWAYNAEQIGLDYRAHAVFLGVRTAGGVNEDNVASERGDVGYITFTIEEESDVQLWAYTGYGNVYDDYKFGLQLEAGEVNTDFAPYGEEQFLLSLIPKGGGEPVQLRSLPDGTRDELVVKDGKSVLVQRVASVDMGTLNYSQTTTTFSDGVSDYLFYNVIDDKLPGFSNSISESFINKGASAGTNLANGEMTGNASSGQVRFRYDEATNSTDFKTRVAGSMLIYPFAEPVEIELEPSELPAIMEGERITLESGGSIVAANMLKQAVHFSIARISDNGVVPLSSGGGQLAVDDKFAPLNVPYKYAVTSYGEDGAWVTETFDAFLKTPRWFVYWGDKMASARWNPEASRNYARPSKKRVFYDGREYPVSYDSTSISETETIGSVLVDEDERMFEQMLRDGGRCVYKSGDGRVFHADAELSEKPMLTNRHAYGEISISLTRIDGEAL